MMAVFYVISSAFSYVLATLMIHLSQKIIRSMRSDIFTKLMKLPVSYFDRMQAGDIISRISYDVDTINASLSNDVIQIATSAITVIGSLIMMLTIYPPPVPNICRDHTDIALLHAHIFNARPARSDAAARSSAS